MYGIIPFTLTCNNQTYINLQIVTLTPIPLTIAFTPTTHINLLHVLRCRNNHVPRDHAKVRKLTKIIARLRSKRAVAQIKRQR